MARVQGDIEVFGIANLLQALSMGKAEGTLAVERGGQRKVLEIASSGIRLLSGARPSRPLGEILIRGGKITPAQLDELLAEQRQSGRPLGEVVAGRGIVPAAVIQSALRRQVAEEIHELFDWADAAFEFVSRDDRAAGGSTDSPLSTVVLGTDVMAIMLDAARRLDELAQIRVIISDDRLVPHLLELPGVIADPAVDRAAIEEVVPLIDGQRSVEDIIQSAIHPQFTVLRTLYSLSMSGVIKIKDRGGKDGPVTVLGRSKDKAPSTKGRTVLLLSESPTLRRGLAVRILGMGYDIVDERPSSDLTRVFGRLPADAVVLDVSLDTPEGGALCEQVRQLSPSPIIVLTEAGGRDVLGRALDSGASFVLLKPINEVLLLQRIEQVLNP